MPVIISNRVPIVANPIADQSFNEDTPYSFTFNSNVFNDPDGNALTYSVSGLPSWLTFNAATRTFSGTPPLNYNGNATITVTATDTGGLSASDTFVLTVLPVNDAPTSTNTTVNTTEDTVLSGTLPAATDVDDDSVTYALATQAAHGIVVVNANGTYSYTPAADYNGADSFTFVVSDGNGGSNTYTVNINVVGVNDAPTSTNTTVNATEDTVLSGTLPSATDVDGDTVTYALATQAAHGIVVVNANGTYSYTPAADYNGADSFAFVVSDGNGGSNTYTVNINVAEVNDVPMVSAPVVLESIAEDSSGITFSASDLLVNASDVDGDELSVSDVALSDLSHGTLTDNEDGTWTFVPAADFNGAVTFTYKVTDGNEEAEASAELEVTEVNDVPVVSATVVLESIAEDSSGITFSASDLLVNASDVDGDELSVSDVALADLSHGTLTDNEDGTWTFVPAADFNGAVTFTYKVTDGNEEAIASAELEVTEVNDVPVVSATVVLESIAEDSSGITFSASDLLVNASDVDGDELSVSDVALADLSHGTLTDNEDGTWTFVPAADFNGAVTFTYKVTDGNEEAEARAELEVVNDYADITIVQTQEPAPETSAQAQVSTVTLSGTPETGDTYSIIINEEVFTYTATGEETLENIAFILSSQINDLLGADLAATYIGSEITVTANIAGTGFDIFATGTNGVEGIDDSTVVTETVTENVEYREAEAQVETVTVIGNSIDVGDTFTINLTGYEPIVYVASSGDTPETIAQTLTSLINASGAADILTASFDGNVITITADTPGEGFELAASAANAEIGEDDSLIEDSTLSYQVNTLNLGESEYQPGDIITVTIGEVAKSYTVLAGDSVDEIGAALATEFAGDSTVSVSYDADTNTVFFTAKEAGESFDFDASVANVNYDEDAPVDTDVTNGVAAAPQQTEVALGSVEYNTGDVITVNIGSTLVSYTVLAGDSIDDIGVALADLVDLENGVAASYNVDTNLITITPDNAVVITSDVAKTTFSENEATSENDQDASSGSAGVKQVVSATFEDSTVSPGEVFSVTITDEGGVPEIFSYTAAAGNSLVTVLNKLATAINASAGVNVSAVRSGSSLFITADAAGNEFEVSILGDARVLTGNVDPTSPTEQITSVDLGAVPYDEGDVVNINIDGVIVATYTVQAGDSTDAIGSALEFINDDYFAEYSDGVLVVTGTNGGSVFTVTPEVVNAEVSESGTTDTTIEAVDAEAEVHTIDLTGTSYDAGDILTLTISGTEYSYTVQAGDTPENVASELAALAAAGGATVDGTVVYVTGNADGSSFDVVFDVDNFGLHENAVTETVVTPNVEAVEPVAQKDVISFTDESLDVGDKFTITIDGASVSYYVQDGDTTINDVLSNLVSLINANDQFPVASLNGLEITLTARVAGTSFETEAAVENASAGVDDNGLDVNTTVQNQTAQAQISTVSIGEGPFDAGDVITITIDDDATFTYTVEENGATAADIASAVAALFSTSSKVTAEAVDGEIVLTGVDNDGFTISTNTITDETYTDGETSGSLEVGESNEGETVQTQISTVSIGEGPFDAGDVITITIEDDATFTYTVEENGATAADVASAVAALFSTSSKVTAEAVDGEIILTGVDNDGFTISTNTITDETYTDGETSGSLEAGESNEGETVQTQISTVSIGEGPFDAGDVITIIIEDDDTFTYTVEENGATAADVASTVAALFSTSSKVTAEAVDGEIVLTGVDNDGFTISTNTITDEVFEDNDALVTIETPASYEVSPVAQVSTLTFTEAIAPGTYTVTINGTEVSYTAKPGATLTTVLNGLKTAISANPDINSEVSAIRQGSQLIISSKTAGEEFTITSGTVGSSIETPTPNVEGVSAEVEETTIDFGVAGYDAGDSVTVAINGITHEIVITETTSPVDLADLVVTAFGEQSGFTLINNDGVLTISGTAIGHELNVTASVEDYSATTNAGDINVDPTQAAVSAATPQVDVYTLAGASDIGDSITVTIGENEYTVTINGDDISSLDELAAALVIAINDGEEDVTASYDSGADKLTLTGKADGTSFDSTVNGEDYSGTANTGDINVDLTQAAVSSATPQVDVYTLAGASDIGDSITVTIGENEYTVTINGDDISSLDELAAALVIAINDGETDVTASYDSGADKLTLTGKADGTSFDSTVNGEDYSGTANTGDADIDPTQEAVANDVKQVTEVSFDGDNSPEYGDVYSITIKDADDNSIAEAAITVAYEDSESHYDILDSLGDQIQLLTSGDISYSVEDDGNGGYKLVLTSENAGIPFTVEPSVVNRAEGQDNTQPEVSNDTENVEEVIPETQTVEYDLGEQRYDAGDVFSLTVNGAEYTYTVTGNEADTDEIIDAVAGLLDDAGVTASNDSGKLKLQANISGSSFTYSLVMSNIELTENVVTIGEDSVTSNDEIAQVSTVVITAGTIEAGDTYSVTLNGYTESYVLSGDEEVGDIVSALIDQLETWDTTEDFVFEAVESESGSGVYDVIKITAVNPGVDFTLESEVINRPAGADDTQNTDITVENDNVTEVDAVAQVETVTVSTGTIEVGDTYSVTIDGHTESYVLSGDETVGDIVSALLDQLELWDLGDNFTFEAAESENGSGVYDVIKVTANNVGTGFTIEGEVLNRSEADTDDNGAVIVTPTPNVEESDALAGIFDVTVLENLVNGDSLFVLLDTDNDGDFNGVADLSFEAVYNEGQSVSDFLQGIADEINDHDFSASVDGNILQIIGQPETDYDVHAIMNMVNPY